MAETTKPSFFYCTTDCPIYQKPESVPFARIAICVILEVPGKCDFSLLVEFRKRLDDDVLAEVNEMIIAYNTPDDPGPDSGGDVPGGSPEGSKNNGTIILDATCAPQNISYPQDVNLLNEARENLEALIDRICYDYNYYKPRMYRNNARRDYLDLARCRKRTSKNIRRAIKKQLQYIRLIVRGKAAEGSCR